MKSVLPPGAEAISGWRVVELLWPLLEMLWRQAAIMAALPYDAAFEGEADDAIKLLAKEKRAPWRNLSPGAWRVLLERHLQLVDVALANEVVGNPVTYVPQGLTEDEQRVGVALLLLLRMKLPWPPADRTTFQPPPDWRVWPRTGH